MPFHFQPVPRRRPLGGSGGLGAPGNIITIEGALNPLGIPGILPRRRGVRRAGMGFGRSGMGGSNGLGDTLCVEGDCRVGDAAVTQMVKAIDALRAQRRAEPFEIAAQSIYAAWEKTKGAKRYVPFHPVCCEVREIGKQAEALTDKMLSATGNATVNAIIQQSPTELLGTALKWGVGIGVVGLGAWAAVQVVAALRSTRRPALSGNRFPRSRRRRHR